MKWLCQDYPLTNGKWSHPSRGAWIEMIPPLELPQDKQASHPSRGAWIEIALAIRSRGNKGNVAPLAGCVD